MKLGILLVRHPPERPSPIVPETIRILREWRVRVDVIYADERSFDLAALVPDCDLYVLKSGTETALSIAGAFHAAGAAMLNAYPVAAVCRDKIVSTRLLAAAGVPVPPSWVAGRVELLRDALDDGPLIVKPYRGSQGRGVAVVTDTAALRTLGELPGPVFAQRHVSRDGLDHKMYCIGGRVFGVRRKWPARSLTEKLGEPFTVPAELNDLVLRAGAAFGMNLFGLDVVFSHGRPLVVDISSFPGFKGVPDAALRLAEYIFDVGSRAARGELVTSIPQPLATAFATEVSP
jgi:ribosomal protein S6--L-glutamate ligase